MILNQCATHKRTKWVDIIKLYLTRSILAEVVRAMDFLVSEGLIMYWGTAKWSPIDITEMYTACRQLNCSTPILEQSEYHMLSREKVEIYMPELYNKIGQHNNIIINNRDTVLIKQFIRNFRSVCKSADIKCMAYISNIIFINII